MPSPWFFFVLIATWMVVGCLRVVGNEYASAIAWHDLRVRVQKLRRDQQRRLEACAESEPSLRRIQRGPKRKVPSLTEASEAVEVAEGVEVAEPVEVGDAIEVGEAIAA